jgi:hypothetical protein
LAVIFFQVKRNYHSEIKKIKRKFKYLHEFRDSYS